MLNSIANQSYNNQKRLNIFYFSDYHGNIPAFRRLKNASDEFDNNHKDTDNFKLTGGDITAGNDLKKNILIFRLLKKMNIDASAVGNHEWDNGTNFYGELNKLFKIAPRLLFNNYISCNSVAADDKIYKEEGLLQSKIITKNNEKFGIVGATANDYKFNDCKINDLGQTKKDISREIERLKEKDPSLNKFILLSHLGIKVDREIAKSVPDIDIIVGGHSHTLLKGVVPEQNLFMSPKNEPVLIVQAGNERNCGEVSVEFDKEGRINLSKGHEPVNITKSIYDYNENQDVKDNEDQILEPALPLGTLSKTIRPENPLVEENPLANLGTDAMRKTTNADVALTNAGTYRAFIEAGPLTSRNLEYCIPFSNTVVKIKCTGKQIADIIKLGVDSTGKENANQGLFQISGLKYTVNADKQLVNLYTVDKNGNKQYELVDSQGNFTEEGANKEFTVALTDYMIVNLSQKGIMTDYVKTENDKTVVDDKHIIQKYDTEREVLINYLKTDFAEKNKPVDIETGRITFEKSNKPESTDFLSLITKFMQ
ncbi:MAG: 5'-nucleotidase C-terminal domain-containing protein [bacterium]